LCFTSWRHEQGYFMTLQLRAPRVPWTPPAADTSADAAYLLTLIEKQPSCLLRVGLDGLLLAANRSALRLLGARDLAQVLDRKLTERILPGHHERWRDFLAQVWESGSGSIECDLTAVSGVQRTLFLDGIALREHPDGRASMLVGARVMLADRRLAPSFDDHELERQRLVTLVQEHEAARQHLETAHAADRAILQQTLAEERQLALMLKEREGRQMLEGVRAELDHVRAELQQTRADERRLATLLAERDAEHQRLATLLAERDAGRQHLATEHAIERGEVEQILVEEEQQQRAQLLKERKSLWKLADHLRAELESATAEHQRLVTAHAVDRAQLRQALAEEYQLSLLLEEDAHSVTIAGDEGRAVPEREG
jgi:hypothetical protein